MNKPEKPEWKWYFAFPFTRGARDYKRDRERYDDFFLNSVQMIRKKEEKAINSVSILIITLATTLWTLLPPLTQLPSWLDWMKMGMEGFGTKNWGNQMMLTLIPTTSGTIIHKFPYIIPNKGIKIAINLLIKIVPIIVLIITWYLVYQEKQIRIIKKQIKDSNAIVTKTFESIPIRQEN